jgi:hypothetical protein
LPPTVARWRYTLENDWSGDPAIFFWIILTDEAARVEDPSRLSEVTRPIADLITREIDPLGEWGLIPYFHFRSQSEQAKLKEKVFG